MARGKRDGLLIAGGGLAGSLAALAMAKARPEIPLLLVEEQERFGGGERIWSFLDPEIDARHRWLVDPLVSLSWPACYLAFPDYSRKLKIGWHSIGAAALDAAVRETLGPKRYRLGTKVVAVRENELVLTGGEKIRADGAIDARGATAHLSLIEPGWRICIARRLRLPRPHRVDLPVLADATVELVGGYRFFSCLPLSEEALIVQGSFHSATDAFELEALREAMDDYLALRGWKDAATEHEEAGAQPIAPGGDLHALWRSGGARVARFGVRGGFFDPITGSALADAVRTAIALTGQEQFDGAVLDEVFEAEAGQLWRRREFHRNFATALFQAPAEQQRQMSAALFRLDPGVIARFLGGQPSLLDRRRIAAIRSAAG